MSTPTSHDAIFKKFFRDIEVAIEFIEVYLPEHLQQKCDFSTLKIEPGSFVDKNLKQHHSDILYSLKLEGVKSYVYINVEHQSIPDKLMPFRMLRYKLAIMKQHIDQGNKKLPLVISMLFYHGKKHPYPYSLELTDCFENTELAKAYFYDPPLLVDLSSVSDDEISRHKKLGLLELVQEHIFTRDLSLIAEDLTKLVKSSQPEHELFHSLVYYILSQGDTSNINQVIETFNTIENYREDVMNAAQQLKQQGREEGREEGQHEGFKKGKHAEALAIAKNMLADQMSFQAIEKYTNLSKKELLELGCVVM
ncbi:MAG: Rpn family recombination-promoting nuclease/putative transposase [Pseudomonadota bacterium]